MTLVIADRVKDTTTTTGTGTVTLSGTAPTGYQNFSTIGNGNTTYYTIVGGAEWEVGLGTYTSSGTTLARTTVYASSNAGSLVNFSAGTKDVFVSYPASIAPLPASPYTLIGSATPTGVSTVNFTSIPDTYSDLLIVFEGLSLAGADLLTLEASGDNNTTRCFIGTYTVAAGSETLYGALTIPGYTNAAGRASELRIADLSADTTSNNPAVDRAVSWRIAAGINALRVSTFTATNFDGGTISVYGLTSGNASSGGGGGVSDGDYGDITVSSAGTVWTIDNDAVTYAKMQDVSATDKLLGRSTAGAGIVEEIACTAAGRAILDDADASAQRTTLGLAIGANVQAYNAQTVIGPGSATDNAIVRYDSTTGALVQNSAATVSDDGVIRSATNSAANAVATPLMNWMMLTADYTLSNVGTEQKAFNTTTNGTLTLPTGVYTFDCWLYLTTMSATSGNLAFDPVGAGTAVTDRWGQNTWGIDNNSPLNAGTQTGSASVTQQTVASAATAGTGTGMQMRFSGMFRISTGGTIIPSVTLVTAAAAVVKAGSWFQISKIGESSETSLGAWT